MSAVLPLPATAPAPAPAGPWRRAFKRLRRRKSAMLGLVIVVPWLAHASWHAYRDVIEPVQAPGHEAR